jgi:hypothetical protein
MSAQAAIHSVVPMCEHGATVITAGLEPDSRCRSGAVLQDDHTRLT